MPVLNKIELTTGGAFCPIITVTPPQCLINPAGPPYKRIAGAKVSVELMPRLHEALLFYHHTPTLMGDENSCLLKNIAGHIAHTPLSITAHLFHEILRGDRSPLPTAGFPQLSSSQGIAFGLCCKGQTGVTIIQVTISWTTLKRGKHKSIRTSRTSSANQPPTAKGTSKSIKDKNQE